MCYSALKSQKKTLILLIISIISTILVFLIISYLTIKEKNKKFQNLLSSKEFQDFCTSSFKKNEILEDLQSKSINYVFIKKYSKNYFALTDNFKENPNLIGDTFFALNKHEKHVFNKLKYLDSLFQKNKIINLFDLSNINFNDSIFLKLGLKIFSNFEYSKFRIFVDFLKKITDFKDNLKYIFLKLENNNLKISTFERIDQRLHMEIEEFNLNFENLKLSVSFLLVCLSSLNDKKLFYL